MNSHSAATSTSATSRPPFYWKVPGIEKDYMYENVQRIRKVNAQNRLKTEPMKAAFIPGVTKNAKYAHITSRVGEILRHPSERGETGDGGFRNIRSQFNSFSSNSRVPPKGNQARGSVADSRRVNSTTNGPVNRRLSRSSTDLASLNNAQKKTAIVNSASAASLTNSQQHFKGSTQIGVDGPGNYVPRSRRKPKGLQIEDESVYNWRFSDNQVDLPVSPQEWNGRDNGKIKNYHRVEYLPCDGICADETIEERVSDGSGRSSSRTSRGINTEETRIIEDLQSLDLQERPNNASNQSFNSEHFHRSTPNPALETNEPKTNGASEYFMDQPYITNQDKRNDASGTIRKQGVMKDVSSFSIKPVGSVLGSGRSSRTDMGMAPELPHTLGTVPKYLKQRQEEWKTEADKVAAAQTSPDVPHGHVLLPELERLETLADLKSKYALLIDELNRVPIRIDTMRVREYKIQLEQQLQKLERGMAIFSRSRVFVKLPDSGAMGDNSSK